MRFLLLTALAFMLVHLDAIAQVSPDTINRLDSSCTRPDGYWKIFGRNIKDTSYRPDELVEEGEYRNGRKIGEWITYYPGGQIKMRMVYSEPILTPPDKREALAPPDTAINIVDSGCTRRNGYYKVYGRMIRDTSYRPEELVEEGMYRNGYKVGEWITYYPGGQIKMRMVYSDPKLTRRDKRHGRRNWKKRRIHPYW